MPYFQRKLQTGSDSLLWQEPILCCPNDPDDAKKLSEAAIRFRVEGLRLRFATELGFVIRVLLKLGLRLIIRIGLRWVLGLFRVGSKITNLHIKI